MEKSIHFEVTTRNTLKLLSIDMPPPYMRWEGCSQISYLNRHYTGLLLLYFSAPINFTPTMPPVRSLMPLSLFQHSMLI